MNITEFLLARIAEDEDEGRDLSKEDPKYSDAKGWDNAYGERLLAECAAKRAIVALCREDHEHSMGSGDDTTELASEVLYALAAVYADHADYNKEWAL